MKQASLILSFLALIGCASSNVEKEFGPLKAVEKVDLPKYLGTWYVIANIPTFLEKGAVNATEIYTWNEKENRIDVQFHFNQDTADGKLKEYTQKAFIYDEASKAEWRIQPFWPLKLAYLIIDIAPDYSYTIVGVPNRNYVWIMARTKKMDEALYQSLVQKLAQVGYDTALLQKVPQF